MGVQVVARHLYGLSLLRCRVDDEPDAPTLSLEVMSHNAHRTIGARAGNSPSVTAEALPVNARVTGGV